MESANKTDIEVNKAVEDKKPTYKWYIEYNEGLEYKRENINLNGKSDIVRILKPKKYTESKSLTDKLLLDATFPLGYIFSIAGKEQIHDIKEFEQLFTLSIKVCDSNNNELSPDSRIIIHKEKDINEYETDVVRLESTFYKNVSMTKFCKEPPNSIKTTDELYKFGQGIEFNGNEHLRIYVVDSDIDINPENVDVNINLDRWQQQ
jgi:hypothetical protein